MLTPEPEMIMMIEQPKERLLAQADV